jgi:2-dehydro-3-deoxyphosphogluconate aldolase / (4S)-4-hydroxy-2-oxoglutarate aldolase
MDKLFSGELKRKLQTTGIAAVLVVDRADDGVPLAETLVEAGIDIMELTLRTPAALQAMIRIHKEVPQIVCGAGTVLTPDQVVEAKDAGAVFGVAPGTNRRVLEKSLQVGFPFAPGVATPSDIEQALEFGCRILKFFPAEQCGGMPYLKSMAAPYAHLGIRYIPLGGIHAGNLASYAADPLILALGGSWIAPRDLIQKKDWQAIGQAAREARQIIERTRLEAR